MTTHLTNTIARPPSHLPTPPPLALDLRHAGRPVGWVRGDAVGFRGFASNVEAAHAAWVAYRAIAQRLAKAGGRRPIPVDTERLTLRRHGDVELVVASGRPIATVLRPGAESRSGDSFGFEIRIPAPTYETRQRAMAYLAYRAMRKSGVRWALWARGQDSADRRAREVDDTLPERSTAPRAPRTSRTPRAPRTPTAVTITATAGVTGLLLAFAVPDHLAGPMGVLGLASLLVSRLLLPRAGWPTTRPLAAHPSPDAGTSTPIDPTTTRSGAHA